MIKKLLTLFAIVLTYFSLAVPVSAHVLKVDGSIGAVLHVDPDDDPIAGQPSSFFFEFKDKDNKFQPQSCDCTFFISQEGKQLFSQPLFQSNPDPSLTNASVTYTFPEKDVYQLVVTGQPTAGNSFQKFSLSYDIRVARQAAAGPASTQTTTSTNWFTSHWPYFLAGFILIGFLIFATTREKMAKKGQDKQY